MKDQHDTSTIDIDDAIAQQTEQVGDKASAMENGLTQISVIVSGRDGEKTITETTTMFEGKAIDCSVLKNPRLEWFPKDKLKFKGTLERNAQRKIAKYGISYGTSVVIPVEDEGKLKEELLDIQSKFFECVEDLRNNFDTWLEEHIKEKAQEQPEVEAIIRKIAMSPDEFCDAFKFEVMPSMYFKPYLNEEIDRVVDVLKDSLYDDIAKAADKMLQDTFLGHDKKTQKAITPIRHLRQKVEKMSFIDPRFDSLLDEIDEVLSEVPLKGAVEGNPLRAITGMLANMADPALLKTSIIQRNSITECDDFTDTSLDEVDVQTVDSGPSTSGFGEW